MAVELAQGYVTLLPSAKGFQAKLEAQISPQARAAGETAGTEASRGFSQSWASTAKGVLAGAVVYQGLSKAASFAGNAIFGFNSQLQNSQIAFTTMLGSGQKAKSFLDQLQSFAKKTPFTFPQLVQNAQLLMGMGIAAKDVIPDLTALGDSTASVGGNTDVLNRTILAFSQMSARGRVDMQDMNQLLEGGMPNALRILAASFHTTTGNMIQMISAGKVSSDQALPLLVQGIEQGTSATAALGGMMDKQSHTFMGALSNISDGLQQTLAKAFRPFFNAVNAAALGFANWLSSANKLGPLTGIIRRNADVIKAVAIGVAAATVAWGTYRLAMYAATIATRLFTAATDMNPVLLAIGAVAAAAYLIATHWAAVKSFFVGLWNDIVGIFNTAINWIVQHWQMLAQILLAVIAGPFGAIAAAIWRWHDQIIAPFVDAANWLVGAGRAIVGGLWAGISFVWTNILWPFINGIRTLFIDFWTKGAGSWLIAAGQAVFGGLWAGLTAVWNTVIWPFISTIFVPIIRAFAAAISWLFGAGLAILQGLWNGINWVWSNVIVLFYYRLPAMVIGFFVSAITWLVGAGINIMTGLFNGIWSIASTIGGWIGGHIILPVLSAFAAAGSWLLSAGEDIIGGFLGGIVNKMKGIAGWIKSNIIDPVVNAVKSFFGISSPSKVFEDIGGNLISGFIKGFQLDPLAIAKKVFGSLPAALGHMVLHGLISAVNLPAQALQALGGAIGSLFGPTGPAVGYGGVLSLGNIPNINLQGLSGSVPALMQAMAAQMFGWTGPEWQALNYVEMREAGYNLNARNPSSGAYGLAQGISGPGWYYGFPGGNPNTAAGQITAMLQYIRQRYGDPIAAAAHEQAFNWYDKGGIWRKGTMGVFGGTVDEAVIPLTNGAMAGLRTLGSIGTGPLTGGGGVTIANAQFNDPVDVDMLMSRVDFYLRAQMQ